MGSPADRSPMASLLKQENTKIQPSRVILETADAPSPALLTYIDKNGYELNREFPDQDFVKKALQGLFAGMIGVGFLLSVLSITTFATSFKLVISRSAGHTKNLLLLGFFPGQIAQVFYQRFQKLFLIILLGSNPCRLQTHWLFER